MYGSINSLHLKKFGNIINFSGNPTILLDSMFKRLDPFIWPFELFSIIFVLSIKIFLCTFSLTVENDRGYYY